MGAANVAAALGVLAVSALTLGAAAIAVGVIAIAAIGYSAKKSYDEKRKINHYQSLDNVLASARNHQAAGISQNNDFAKLASKAASSDNIANDKVLYPERVVRPKK